MNYRRLGSAGLRVSELSLGAWVTYGGQVGEDAALKCMSAAYDAGVNFFDNAEAYANGNAERVMGNVIKRWAGLERSSSSLARFSGAAKAQMIGGFPANISTKRAGGL
jgi:aryl-alcohol dehydrogenase-like predicted oxidoreductase